jgi:AcrR family transcriptional regulator
MQARARAVEATTRRVLDAAFELFTENPYEEVSLEDVGARARVTKRTLLRRFGTKDQLFVAAMEVVKDEIRSHRFQAPVGDVPGAVRNLVEGYERWGDNNLRLLSEEDRIPLVREIGEYGRRAHRQWVKQTFAPLIEGLGPTVRRRRVTGLVAITDVYTWKLLRRDLGLSRGETERTLSELIMALEGGV